jgi:hypothetical protein
MPEPAQPPRRGLPAGVWVPGFLSLLMDVSSEMIQSLLPMFLAGPPGISVLAIGLTKGVAESTALIARFFSGSPCNYLGGRKALAVSRQPASARRFWCRARNNSASRPRGCRW